MLTLKCCWIDVEVTFDKSRPSDALFSPYLLLQIGVIDADLSLPLLFNCGCGITL